MIVPDINLLLYAYDSASPFHAKAASWWKASVSGVEPVGLPHAVVFGFVRVGTSARAYSRRADRLRAPDPDASVEDLRSRRRPGHEAAARSSPKTACRIPRGQPDEEHGKDPARR